MTTRTLRRFSSYLTATIVTLVTGSIVLISASLFIHFELRLESEFRKSLLAQEGQLEIIIENQIQTVQHQLKEVSLDNTLRFSMILDKPEQVRERLRQLSAAVDGAVFAVVKEETGEMELPDDAPISTLQFRDLIDRKASGEILEIDGKTHLVWCFSTPIPEAEIKLGTTHVAYDMMADHALIQTIRRNIDGHVAVAGTGGFISLLSNSSLPLSIEETAFASPKQYIDHVHPDWAFAALGCCNNLFYVSSRKDLTLEKKGIALLIGLSGLLVLGLSVTISFFLSRQLSRPLGEMATKAIQISEGNKKIFFGNSDGKFLEFRLLHQAFDQMLMNLITAEEKSRYKELLGNVDDAVYLIDRSGGIVDANEATYLRLGYSAETFSGLNMEALLPVEEANLFMAQLAPSESNTQGAKKIVDTYHIRQDGSRFPVEINSRPILYRGRPALLHVARDLTQRETAENALRESERRYRMVVENSHSGILILGMDFQILYGNNEIQNILGYSLKELRDQPFQAILNSDTPGYLKTRFWHAEIPVAYQSVYEHDLLRKDGCIRRCKTRATLIEGNAGNVNLLLQILDITETLQAEKQTKKLEAQLFQAQKMQAIGRLAGGIAHDFNNLLMAIQGRLSLMRLNSEAESCNADYIDEIEKSVKSAANLTRQLLGFARGGKYQAKTTNLNDLIEKTIHMFQRTHTGIAVSTRYQEKPWFVEVDHTQLDQVLLNLFLNAAHAMPNGGDLIIQTRNRTLNGIAGIDNGLPPGNYVNLSVTDTGTGMDPDVKERVFEPFFTTKPLGMGTGLGLASAYGIIKNHKGSIHVESEKGRGSTIHIHLPASVGEILPVITPQPQPLNGKKTILIVDDQPVFLDVSQAMIEQLGYRTITAHGGKRAIDLLAGDASFNPNLVVLDLVMPEMSGPEVFEKMKLLRKDIRVLMCSGYSLTHQVERLMARGCNGFIQKPFNISELSRKINEILN